MPAAAAGRGQGLRETRSPGEFDDYCARVGITEYAPGDVVHFPAGPFWDVCGVVREVDTGRGELRIEFDEGLVHRDGGVLRGRRHSMTVRFDEVELF